MPCRLMSLARFPTLRAGLRQSGRGFFLLFPASELAGYYQPSPDRGLELLSFHEVLIANKAVKARIENVSGERPDAAWRGRRSRDASTRPRIASSPWTCSA
jgi:hypothetical protein